jgi:hypothetical protein
MAEIVQTLDFRHPNSRSGRGKIRACRTQPRIAHLASDGQTVGSTADLLGTTGWRQQVVDFVTGPEARLITIRVMRVPGNPLIKGTFWLDDVQLAHRFDLWEN